MLRCLKFGMEQCLVVVNEVCSDWGWSGGAIVLDKHPVPGSPFTLDNRKGKGPLRLQ